MSQDIERPMVNDCWFETAFLGQLDDSDRLKRSSVDTATRTPCEVLARLCPDLPTRWTRLLTCRGDMYWTTRSTEPMSIPSSRVLVQTSPLIWPALNASSARPRSSSGSEPWWTIILCSIMLDFELSISALILMLTR